MAYNLSDYAENLLLSWMMTGAAVARPAAWYLALYTVAPGESGGGAEVSGNGYARQALAMPAPSGGEQANTAEITFVATGGDWGAIAGVAIHDAATGGNMLWYGVPNQIKTVTNGDNLAVQVGALTLSLD